MLKKQHGWQPNIKWRESSNSLFIFEQMDMMTMKSCTYGICCGKTTGTTCNVNSCPINLATNVVKLFL